MFRVTARHPINHEVFADGYTRCNYPDHQGLVWHVQREGNATAVPARVGRLAAILTAPKIPIIRAINAILLGVLILLLLGSILTLADFSLHREDFRFGTEVAGLFYRSAAMYSEMLLAEIVVLSVGVAFSVMTKSLVASVLIRAIAISVYIGFIVAGLWLP